MPGLSETIISSGQSANPCCLRSNWINRSSNKDGIRCSRWWRRSSTRNKSDGSLMRFRRDTKDMPQDKFYGRVVSQHIGRVLLLGIVQRVQVSPVQGGHNRIAQVGENLAQTERQPTTNAWSRSYGKQLRSRASECSTTTSSVCSPRSQRERNLVS